jgi:hypothetical protein
MTRLLLNSRRTITLCDRNIVCACVHGGGHCREVALAASCYYCTVQYMCPVWIIHMKRACPVFGQDKCSTLLARSHARCGACCRWRWQQMGRHTRTALQACTACTACVTNYKAPTGCNSVALQHTTHCVPGRIFTAVGALVHRASRARSVARCLA